MVKCKYGRIVSNEGKMELWMYFAGTSSSSPSGEEHLVVSWNIGNCNLVLSVPHAGTFGADQTQEGNLLCQSGHVLESRRGSPEHPVKRYGRDAGTDFISAGIESLLATNGTKPHVIQCHIHRNKVEVNVDICKWAVQHRGHEGEFIHYMYHRWISKALQQGRDCDKAGAALLIDLHGHGHPHNYIELGYRVPGQLLNEIAKETGSKSSKKEITLSILEELKYFSIPDSYIDKDSEDSQETNRIKSWRSILTSPVKHEFTLSQLAKRRFGTSNESIKECLIGETSFGGILSKHLSQNPSVSNIKSIPSKSRPSPGRLGYYTGGYTVLKHARLKGVDAVQVELPIPVRTHAGEKRDAITAALAGGVLEFHRKHYQMSGDKRETVLDEEYKGEVTLSDEPVNQSMTAVPLCQVNWLWKGKKLIRTSSMK